VSGLLRQTVVAPITGVEEEEQRDDHPRHGEVDVGHQNLQQKYGFP
jgi:hypothetical protein